MQRKKGTILKVFDIEALKFSASIHSADIFPIHSPALKVGPNAKTVGDVRLS